MTDTIKQRSSNFELLRLVAIFFITMHHLTINNVDVCGYNHPYSLSQDGWVGVVINSTAIIGVNLFVLISGWFGIRRIWSNIIRLVLDVVLLGLVNITACSLLFGYTPTFEEMMTTCDFFNNWYVVHFIILIMLSPLLEAALRNMEFKTLAVSWIMLAIITVYFGWRKGVLNPNGYNAFNFIFLYISARLFRRAHNENKSIVRHLPSAYYLILWGGVILAETVLYILQATFEHARASMHFWAYNAPWVLLSSFAVFMIFAQLKIRYSRFINTAATGCLGIYVLQSTAPFNLYRGQLLSPFYDKAGWLGVVLFALLLYSVLCTIAVLYTHIYRKIEQTIIHHIRQ